MPVRILFATHYTGLGGGETALLTLAQHLDPARYQPHLLAPREGQLAARWRAQGWPVHVTPWRGATVYFLPPVWARLPSSRRMQRLIAARGIDIVHSDYHSLPMALPAAERAGVPALWTCMGWWFQPKPWQRAFFRRVPVTFAHSEAIKRGFLGEPPFMPPGRVEVLYPGVDTTRFHPELDGRAMRHEAGIREDAPVVAMVARFQAVKGHETFQDMARRVASALPEARFLVAGENVHGVTADEAYKQRILNRAQEDPDLRERLIYLGFRSDVERVLAAADVVVCASHFESFGVANVEAMACGKPIVSTNRGGPSETVVDGETGFLVPPGDAEALADRVMAVLADSSLRKQLGEAGRERAERLFSARATAGRFAHAVDRLVRTPP